MNWVKKLKENWPIPAISIIYLSSFLYMLPLRDSVYGDDFAFIQMVKHLYETGIFKVSDWSYASFITQTYWGALFSFLAGEFSQHILHLSTVVILFPGLIAFYLLLRELEVNKTRSFIFTIILLFFPHVFFMTYTFLSNVPTMSLIIISMLFYIKGLKYNKGRWFLLGSIFGILAFLNRQDALLLPVCFFLSLIFKRLSGTKIRLRSFILFLLPILPTLIWYKHWVSFPENVTIANVRFGFQSPDGMEETIMQFLPIPLNRIYTTNIYYAKYIQSIIFYFFNIIGFLLPVFLIFLVGPVKIIRFLFTHYKAIFLTTLFFLAVFSVEYFFHYIGPVYEIDGPSYITIYNSFLRGIFNRLVIISIPIWLILFGGIAGNFFNRVFTARKRPLSFISYKKLIIIALVFVSWLYIKALYSVYSTTPTSLARVLGTFLHYSWLIPAVYLFLILIVGYLVLFFTINKKILLIKPETIFLLLIFIFYVITHLFFMHYRWPNYIPTLLPYVIIWLACTTRSLKMNYIAVVIVLSIYAYFSVTTTKLRYEEDGFQFELAMQVVKKGISPLEVKTTTWELGWLPYWYYEPMLKDEVQKAKGNKYKIDDLGPWHQLQDHVPTYFITEVPLNFDPSSKTNWEIIIDTGPQYSSIFRYTRYIAFKYKIVPIN